MQILRKTINFAATFGETRLKVNGYHRFEWVDIVRFLHHESEVANSLFICMFHNVYNYMFNSACKGKTVRKAMEDFFIARDEMKQMYEDEGRQFI